MSKLVFICSDCFNLDCGSTLNTCDSPDWTVYKACTQSARDCGGKKEHWLSNCKWTRDCVFPCKLGLSRNMLLPPESSPNSEFNEGHLWRLKPQASIKAHCLLSSSLSLSTFQAAPISCQIVYCTKLPTASFTMISHQNLHTSQGLFFYSPMKSSLSRPKYVLSKPGKNSPLDLQILLQTRFKTYFKMIFNRP